MKARIAVKVASAWWRYRLTTRRRAWPIYWRRWCRTPEGLEALRRVRGRWTP